MHLPFRLPFFGKTRKDESHYFCLYVTDVYLTGFIVDVTTSFPKILASKRQPLSAGFEKILEDTDLVISDLEQKTQVSLSKTIFFLNARMIEQATHEIKEPYKGYIKEIVRELELSAMGYIDTQESIHDYVGEASIINAIFIEINKAEFGVFIYRGGALSHFEYTSLSENPGKDIENALASIPGQNILPPKIYLYGDPQSTLAETLTKHSWSEKIFVQHPIIEVITESVFYNILAASFTKELFSTKTPKIFTTEEAKNVEIDNKENQFGFVVNADVVVKDKPAIPSEKSARPKPKQAFAGILSIFNNIISSITNRPQKIVMKKYMFLVYVVVAILGLALSYLIYEYSFHKAVVLVYLQSKEVEGTLDMDIPISDSKSSKLSLTEHTKVVDYTDNKNTTGTSNVGQKAKGEVVLHNFDNVEKTVQSGTKLKYKELEFVTDSEVKIASASGITSDGTKQSGQAKVQATAGEIGSEYNVAKGTQMTIDSLSNSLYLGITSEAFSGGSKKSIKTVSKNDLQALKDKAETDAKKNSSDILAKSLLPSEVMIGELSSVALSSVVYSHEVGEESDKVSMKASAEINYYTAPKDAFLSEISNLLLKNSEEGYHIDPKTIKPNVESAAIDGSSGLVTIEASGKAYKEVGKDKLINVIVYKPVSQINSILNSRFDVEKAELEDSGFEIPILSSRLPLFSKNINVEIRTK